MVSNSVDEVCSICSQHLLWNLSNPTDNGVFEAWFSADTLGGRAFIREIVQCVPLNLVDIWDRLHYIERYVDCLPILFLSKPLLSIRTYAHGNNYVGPFIYTSNGWFGAWGGLISSCQWCIGLDFVRYDSQSREVKYMMNLVFCSIVTILASISPLRKKTLRFEGAGLSIAAGSITLIVCAYLIGMYKDIAKNVMKLTAVLLFVLWVITAGVCTYIGPFLITGNGFFAVWLSALCALKIAMVDRNS